MHTALYLSKNIKKNYIWSLFNEAIDTFVSWEMYCSSLVCYNDQITHILKCHLLQSFNGAISVAWNSFIQQ